MSKLEDPIAADLLYLSTETDTDPSSLSSLAVVIRKSVITRYEEVPIKEDVLLYKDK